MTEIDGHYNMPDKVDYACRLLRKAVGAHGARLVVMAEPQVLVAIDIAL
jgi:DNA polymerase-3 subunit chi